MKSGRCEDGMKQHTRFLLAIIMAIAVFGGAEVHAQEQPVGRVVESQGENFVGRANGGSEPLSVGTSVFLHDTIVVGSEGEAAIEFVDGTRLTMGSDAGMIIDELVYDPNGQNNSAVFDIALSVLMSASACITGPSP